VIDGAAFESSGPLERIRVGEAVGEAAAVAPFAKREVRSLTYIW
jgi:hypothetical protein